MRSTGGYPQAGVPGPGRPSLRRRSFQNLALRLEPTGATHAVAQAQHGSAPDIAGKDIANPAALIGSAAMLLGWLGERRGDERLARAAAAIEAALDAVIARPEWRTPDLGGPLGTKAFGERVAAEVK